MYLIKAILNNQVHDNFYIYFFKSVIYVSKNNYDWKLGKGIFNYDLGIKNNEKNIKF